MTTWAFQHEGHNYFSAAFIEEVSRQMYPDDRSDVCPACGQPTELHNAPCFSCNMLEMDKHIENIDEHIENIKEFTLED